MDRRVTYKLAPASWSLGRGCLCIRRWRSVGTGSLLLKLDEIDIPNGISKSVIEVQKYTV
jgi:hypothetical protein